jgi:hypothetical protein
MVWSWWWETIDRIIGDMYKSEGCASGTVRGGATEDSRAKQPDSESNADQQAGCRAAAALSTEEGHGSNPRSGSQSQPARQSGQSGFGHTSGMLLRLYPSTPRHAR